MVFSYQNKGRIGFYIYTVFIVHDKHLKRNNMGMTRNCARDHRCCACLPRGDRRGPLVCRHIEASDRSSHKLIRKRFCAPSHAFGRMEEIKPGIPRSCRIFSRLPRSFRNFSVDLSDQPTSPTSVATQAPLSAGFDSPPFRFDESLFFGSAALNRR